jgi:glyoxylase-like metal-dependent hydrolase (beta-lactamase superfamily II)
MLNEYPWVKIGPGLYEINEFDGVSIFVVEGEEKILLIDTGAGIGNIKQFVLFLTGTKPVEVLITHNHRDHAGGAPWFDKVHISNIDKMIGPMVRPLTSRESRLQFALAVKERCKGKVYPWIPEDIMRFDEADEPEVTGVEDGFTFDLGGRKETCLLCPGHTPGSMMVLDSKTKYLFAGDSCNAQLGIGVRYLGGPPNSSVQEALEGLKRIWNFGFDRNNVYCAHTGYREFGKPLDGGIYPALMESLEKISAGDFISRKEKIGMIDAEVDTAEFGGIKVQFHLDNIK